MQTILIEPSVGIGPFKLGMTEQEVKAVLEQESAMYSDLLSIEYDAKGRVTFLEMSNPDDDSIQFLYGDKDVFRTQANPLINELDKETPYDRDDEAEIGVCFVFKEIAMAFWRPVPLTEEMLQSEEFLREVPPEHREQEKKHLFFSTAAVAAKGYW
jgi:Fe-S cluster biosynthesis and repair protein YggX